MLWQNNPGPEARRERSSRTLTNAVKTVARSNHPRIVDRSAQSFAEVFEDRGILRRNIGEVVGPFIDARRQTRGRHIVPENSPIDDLREEGRLRNQLLHQMRDILLSLGGKGLFVPCAA